MRKSTLISLILILIVLLVGCGNKEDSALYYDTFDEGNNVEMRWGGIKTVIPSTWDQPEEETENVASIFANMSSTRLFKFDNMGQDELKSESTIEAISTTLDDYYEQEGYENYEYINGKLYEKGEHKVITSKQILILNYQAKWAELDATFTAYSFVVNNNLYVWMITELSNETYCAINDLEKVVNEVEEDLEWSSGIQNPSDLSEESDVDIDSKLSNIEIRFEVDYTEGDNLYLIVYTKNTSSESFTGDVYVTFYSSDGKDRLGSDLIIVEDLQPGQEKWAKVTVDAYKGTPKMTVDFSETVFAPIEKTSRNVDKEATEKTMKSFSLNFEGVSWYDDVVDIVVYTDGNCDVTVKEKIKEEGQFYASTVWDCGYEYGVETVTVIDSKGNTIAVY